LEHRGRPNRDSTRCMRNQGTPNKRNPLRSDVDAMTTNQMGICREPNSHRALGRGSGFGVVREDLGISALIRRRLRQGRRLSHTTAGEPRQGHARHHHVSKNQRRPGRHGARDHRVATLAKRGGGSLDQQCSSLCDDKWMGLKQLYSSRRGRGSSNKFP